jgi:cob(I)alamin adenosyltransferase
VLTEPDVNSQVMIYLNRLSDLLFVFARVANNGGKGDVLWVPGRNTKASDKAGEAG